jgi:integrase/recombinase XerD
MKSYKQDVVVFEKLIGKRLIFATENDVTKYISFLEKSNYRNSTINRKIYSISKIFKVLVMDGVVEYNPIERLSSTVKLHHKVIKEIDLDLTMEDLELVVKRARINTALIIKTLAVTGMRISELINIRPKDCRINDEYVKIYVRGKGMKERYVYLSKQLFTQINEVFNQGNEYLFTSSSGLKLRRENLYKQIRKAFKNIVDKEIHPHLLRHWFITEQVKKYDVNAVSSYVGHSTASFTLDNYCHNHLKPEEAVILN